MGLGGPVWHASIMPRAPMNVRSVRKLADKVLVGVGDARLGEWEDDRLSSGGAFHLRRRLSESEEARVGPVVDVRLTPEAFRRAKALGGRLAYAPAEILIEELGTDQ